MGTINDLWVSYLKEEGYEGGGYNTLTLNALREATGTSKDSVNTLWHLYLTGLGYSGTINDMQYKWLGDNGYTGSLNDRWKAALEDGFSFFGFDPLSLFEEGQQGAWYDPSDLSTLFQDSAGTTPVTADGDPVGLMLDKSGNDNHASQSTTAAKPTYRTDGTLHWLEGDGVDNFIETGIVPFNGVDFFTSVAFNFEGTSESSFRGVFRFLEEGGNPTSASSNLLEEYAANNAAASTQKTVYQRYPSGKDFYFASTDNSRPPFPGKQVSWNFSNQDGSGGIGVLPTTPSPLDRTGTGTLASGNATLSLFRGYRGYITGMRLYGFIWVAEEVSTGDQDRSNKYLADKAGVTL